MPAAIKKLSRRNFLLTVGAGGAATAAALVAGKRTAPPVAGKSGKHASKGYESSAHVQNYYRTAKV